VSIGMMAGARGSYEFPFGLSIDLAVGYLRQTKTVERTFSAPYGDNSLLTATYAIQDDLLLHGPFAAVGLGYRLGFAEVMELRLHALVGPMLTFSRDKMEATITGPDATIPAFIQDSGKLVSSADFILLPDIHLGIRIDGFGAAIGVSAAVLALAGPSQANQEIKVGIDPGACSVNEVRCLSGKDFAKEEQAYGASVVIVPGASIGYAF
jgi:hypothetical protein